LVTLVAGVAFVVGTIGPPLIGRGVFLATDVLTSAYPWRAVSDPAAENIGVHGPVGDTIDAGYPFRSTFADALRDGDFLGWNPYPVGGTVQGADGSGGTLSPFELLYVVFPTWFAPAAIKLVQLVAAIGFTFLFCRRLGAGQVASLVGGLAFAGSGFMVMWTNWPQPEVAALIPAAFWATERFLTTPTVRSACPIALAMAAMLLGNFPAVVFHTLYVLVPYVIMRVALMHRQTLRRALALIGGAGAAVVTGPLVVAAVLIPFALRLQFLGTESRSQNPQLRLGLDTLLTTVAPKALGLSTEGPNALYFGAYNQVETISFVGATVAVLAVAGVALPRLRATPRGVREVLIVATLVIGWAAYVGGDVLAQLQRLPGFEESFVGRTRAILGFMVAVLAALGLQALVEQRWPAGRRQWTWAGAVIGAAGLTAAYAGNRALWRARGVGQVDVLREQLVLPAVVGIGALVALAVVRWGGRRAALAAMAAVPVLLVIESLALSLPTPSSRAGWPRSAAGGRPRRRRPRGSRRVRPRQAPRGDPALRTARAAGGPGRVGRVGRGARRSMDLGRSRCLARAPRRPAGRSALGADRPTPVERGETTVGLVRRPRFHVEPEGALQAVVAVRDRGVGALCRQVVVAEQQQETGHRQVDHTAPVDLADRDLRLLGVGPAH
jgi:hypothetical protein